MNRNIVVGVVFLVTIGLMAAQNGRGRPGTAQPKAPEKPEKESVTIQGEIEITYFDQKGIGYPAIVVDGKQIKLAPLWYLNQQEIVLDVGDNVIVTASPCNQSDEELYYAITVEVLFEDGSSQIITLRDARGKPAWGGARSHHPTDPASFSRRSKANGNGLVAASSTSVTGTVEFVIPGRGFQKPILLLRTPQGTLLPIVLGTPGQILAWDFEVRLGASLTVRYAFTQRTRERLALQLEDSSGHTITVRTEAGDPVWP